ncbi:hypothetical protein NEISICOT_02178 [Neisseria sicca ATCC 29256]|uniref:Uncharacterized protein n=1 Tax=Neisseria sicca ATCC 29256 TaxID=547045 RepID=C6M6M6_NEISI|nr:hypothetical protein NEISICOT_02178 [Neisseria sicca ATCC 29256]
MPRLAVLSVLSAASSPCPDLNLIHYIKRRQKTAGKKNASCRELAEAIQGVLKVTLKNYETSQKELYY